MQAVIRLVFGLEAVSVPPAVHLVLDARHVCGVRATAAAHVPHAEVQPLLYVYLHGLALVTVYPTKIIKFM